VAGMMIVQGKVAYLESAIRLGETAHVFRGQGECGSILVRQLSWSTV